MPNGFFIKTRRILLPIFTFINVIILFFLLYPITLELLLDFDDFSRLSSVRKIKPILWYTLGWGLLTINIIWFVKEVRKERRMVWLMVPVILGWVIFFSALIIPNKLLPDKTEPSPPMSAGQLQSLESAQEIINKSYLPTINHALESGYTVQESRNPTIALPPGIDKTQIEKIFQFGDLLFALAMKPSTNVPLLDLPPGFVPKFSGVLIAHEKSVGWSKFAEIIDIDTQRKSNPYYLWIKDGILTLSLVDQNGAGSGEGNMSIFALGKNGIWAQKGCYYFGANYDNPLSSGDYFASSKQISQQKEQPIENCKGVSIDSYEIIKQE